MTEQRWTEYNAMVGYLGSNLNALGNNGNELGSAIDFTTSGTDRKIYMDIELYVSSVDWSAQTNPIVRIWILRRTNQSDFEDGSDSITPARQPDAIFILREANSAQRLSVSRILTTPDQAKILVKNETGMALAATGNTLKYNIYSEELV